MESTKFAQTKNSMAGSLQFQDNVDFFYVNGIVHRESVSAGHTVNQKFYSNVLKRLHESLRQNHPEKWHSGDWFLHRDCLRPHSLERPAVFG